MKQINQLLMKKLLVVIFSLICAINLSAQNNSLPQYQGVLCYISVDLDNDSVESGYLRYTFNKPAEALYSGSLLEVQGPGNPCLMNDLGTTIQICLKKLRIATEKPDGGSVWQCTEDLWIGTWQNVGGQQQLVYDKYYSIVLLVSGGE